MRFAHFVPNARLLVFAMAFGPALAFSAAASQVGLPPAKPLEEEPGEEAAAAEAEPADTVREAGTATQRPPRLSVHRENYILVATYSNEPNTNPGNVSGFRNVKQLELKFQFSLRYRLFDFAKREGKIVMAYTNTSFWQVYNWAESAPFRTTDHEPELFYEWSARALGNLGGHAWQGVNRLGIVHESNGEGIALSRSWNRLFAEYLYASDGQACRPTSKDPDPQPGLCISYKVWRDFQHDDVNNPDIVDYMGNFEFRGEWVGKSNGAPRLSIMVRNNLRTSGNKGAVQLDYSHALRLPNQNRIRMKMQYFRGYGESLIDFDYDSQRIGLGFEFTY